MSSKERLDVLLVNRGLADSREKAKAIIMSGNVYVDGQKEDKAGSSFNETVNIEVRGNTLKYVSRGGLKLEKSILSAISSGVTYRILVFSIHTTRSSLRSFQASCPCPTSTEYTLTAPF